MDYKSLVGKTVRLNHAENGDSPYDDSRYDGCSGKVVYVDDLNQIHFEGCPIAIIPEMDDWEILD